MMKKTIKLIVIAIVFIVISILGLYFLRKVLSNSKHEQVFYKVRKEKFENVIEISGTISAAQEQTLQALSAGTVLAVYVKAGQKVKKGDVLIQLDDTTEQYNLAKHDYDMTTKKISGSTKELELMEAQRLSLVQKVNDRKVVATFDGVIADFDVSVGDSLEAKDTVGTIVNVDYLTAEVEVSETDVSKLKVGQKVQLSFPAFSETIVEGYITGWPAIGAITSRGATVVNAKIRVDEYPKQILPNFSFTGKIEISPAQENIIVERYAIAQENGKSYVVKAMGNEKVFVDVVPYGKEFVKVLSGLNGGETLLQLTVPKQSGWNRGNGNMAAPANPNPGIIMGNRM